jgi:hypothetical protein
MAAINGLLQTFAALLIVAIALQIAEYKIPVVDGILNEVGVEKAGEGSGPPDNPEAEDYEMEWGPGAEGWSQPGLPPVHSQPNGIDPDLFDGTRPAAAPAPQPKRSDLEFILDRKGVSL